MPKLSLELDQELSDSYSCYCLFVVDKNGEILLTTDLGTNDKDIENLAGLYLQLKMGQVINTAIADTLSKMTTEEIKIFTKHLLNSKNKLTDKPVIPPIQNVQKPPI